MVRSLSTKPAKVVISACDAICVRFMPLRHSGADHMQAVELLNSLPLERAEIESKPKQARRIISFKNAAENEDRLIRQRGAGNAEGCGASCGIG